MSAQEQQTELEGAEVGSLQDQCWGFMPAENRHRAFKCSPESLCSCTWTQLRSPDSTKICSPRVPGTRACATGNSGCNMHMKEMPCTLLRVSSEAATTGAADGLLCTRKLFQDQGYTRSGKRTRRNHDKINARHPNTHLPPAPAVC